MTVSHAIVILLTLTCQLTPKSNSHISLLLLQLYINYSIFNAIHFSPASCTVQQCIQISTRINSSSVHTYIFVCSTLRVNLQGFVTQNATSVLDIKEATGKENLDLAPHRFYSFVLSLVVYFLSP